MESPSISVIVLAHNTHDLVLQCLSRFYTQAMARGWQIIVVDNASVDGTAQAVAQRFPGVEVIRSERNLGFAGGNNLGLGRAAGQVVILLNNDIIISAEALQGLANMLWAQPTIGAVSAGLLTTEGEPQAFAFGDDPRLSYLIRRGLRALLGQRPMHCWAIDQPIEVDWVSGACLCVRKEAITQVGLLDERFFMYFEDNDWCLRMRQTGWRIVYDPRFKAVHLGGASQPRRQIANRTYYCSLITFYAKHYGPLATAILRLLLSLYTILAQLRYGADKA